MKPNPLASITRDYLKQVGWVLTHSDDPRCDHWVDPRDAERTRRLGGNCFKQAVQIQADYERYDAGLSAYFHRPNQFGYGYEVVRQSKPKDAKSRTIVGRHNSAKVADKYVSMLLEDADALPMSPDTHDYHKVIVLKEKHGDRYLAAPNLDAFYRQCLAVVKSRHEEECWYEYEDPSDVEVPELTKEQVAAMKDGSIKRAAQEAWMQGADDAGRMTAYTNGVYTGEGT